MSKRPIDMKDQPNTPSKRANFGASFEGTIINNNSEQMVYALSILAKKDINQIELDIPDLEFEFLFGCAMMMGPNDDDNKFIYGYFTEPPLWLVGGLRHIFNHFNIDFDEYVSTYIEQIPISQMKENIQIDHYYAISIENYTPNAALNSMRYIFDLYNYNVNNQI